MKKQFAEYYDLPDERIKEIWDNSLIVLDTNVLLNLYRYKEEARNEFINIIKSYKERLWIPYQVGFEFHRNRESIIIKNKVAYRLVKDKLTEQLDKFVNFLNSNGDLTRHPYIDTKDIQKRVTQFSASISKTLDKQQNEHPDYSQNDDILNAITELFDGRVGGDFTDKDIEAIYKEGEKRYANKVPPGYCDEKNKKDKGKRRLYGDLIVWKQTINHCKELEKDIIFITDDHKPDWWDEIGGKHTPRKELIREFIDSTGQNILIYDSSRFLDYAKRRNKIKVSPKTIREVEKVKQEDIETAQRSEKAHYENIFRGINFDAIRELSERLGQYSASMRRMQEQISSSIAVPTLNVEVPNVFQNSDEIVADYERQRKELAQIISPNNNDIEDRN